MPPTTKDPGVKITDVIPTPQGPGTLWIDRRTDGGSVKSSDIPQTTFVPGSGSPAQLPKPRR